MWWECVGGDELECVSGEDESRERERNKKKQKKKKGKEEIL